MPARTKRIGMSMLALALAATSTGLMQACKTSKSTTTIMSVDDEGHAQPARDKLPTIMQAKLAHAQALLEGLALGDYRQIEVNAAALVQISQQAEWMVHDTESYFAMSENFRAAAQTMVEDARNKRLDALSRDYGALTGSCIACHRYLQAEKPTLQMPGRVSMSTR